MVLRLHGYGAWIESDGKPLEEHAVEVKDNVISCYVCSEEGKEFVLRFDDDGSHCPGNNALPHDHGRSLAIEMDGLRVDQVWSDFMKNTTSGGVHVGDLFRPFVFAPVDTTDDDDAAARDDVTNEHIGTIQVKLRRGTKLGNSTDHYNGMQPRTGVVHERSKKAGSHRVALGEAVHKARYRKVHTKYIDHTPWVSFRFLYRKRDVLKARGIIPQSPSPPPTGNPPGPSIKVEGRKGVKREREGNGNDDVIEVFSDDEDLESLQEALKHIQGQIARKKAKKSVKREPGSPAGDIIDLT